MSGWQRSSFCSGGACVEVKHEGPWVFVRGAKQDSGEFLAYRLGEWREFVKGVKQGEFDLEPSDG